MGVFFRRLLQNTPILPIPDKLGVQPAEQNPYRSGLNLRLVFSGNSGVARRANFFACQKNLLALPPMLELAAGLTNQRPDAIKTNTF